MFFNQVLKIAFLAILVSVAIFEVAEAAYKKPPFNGSIFGKRNSIGDYENSGKTLQAVCEVAIEACQNYFSQENKK